MPSLLGRRIPTSAIIASAPRGYDAPAAAGPRAVAAPPSGIGDALATLGKTFQNGTQNALRQEQLQKLAYENQATALAAGAIGADGIITNNQNASIAAALGALDPTKYGRLQAIQAATSGGIDSPKAAEFLTGLGEYRATPVYAGREFANKVDLQGMQEATKLRMNDAQEATKLRLADSALETVVTPEGPRYVRRSDAVGQAPLVSSDQNKALIQSELLPTLPLERKTDFAFGAQSPGELGNVSIGGRTMPAFARPDGFYAPGGGKIEGQVDSFGKLTATTADGLGGDTGIGKDILAGRISTERAVGLIDNLSVELEKPNAGVSIGFLGSVAEAANNVRAQVESGAKAISGLSANDEFGAVKAGQTVNRLMTENGPLARAIQMQGVDKAKLQGLILDLAYAQAKANDPSGRVSNQDIENAGRQVGLGLGDPMAMKAVLGELRERTISGQEVRERNSSQFLKPGQTLPVWDSPIMQGRKGGARPAPATSAPAAGTRLRFDENGNPR